MTTLQTSLFLTKIQLSFRYTTYKTMSLCKNNSFKEDLDLLLK